MHNNYYFLRQLTPVLERAIRLSVVSECFSQNKEELVIRFERQESPFFIRASLPASFACLSFPENVHRARRNSIDLFQQLIGQRVEGVRQFENERSFAIHFTNAVTLLFKMHGNRSNMVLFQNDVVSEIFKNNLPEDASLRLNNLDRTIDWSYENFTQHHQKVEAAYFTFGKVVWRYLRAKGYDALTTQEQWQAILRIRDQLLNPHFSIREVDRHTFFSLLDFGHVIKEFSDPLHAVHSFFTYYIHQDLFVREKTSLVTHLRSMLHANKNYSDKIRSKLSELENDNNYKIWADLLMANLHAIPAGAERVTLADFYHGDHPTVIKLKGDLSPQKNAAIFYKKAKNQHIEISHLQNMLSAKEHQQSILSGRLAEIEAAENIKNLRKVGGGLNLNNEKAKQTESLPYREVEFNGYKIWIGKNAQSNDVLTLKYSYKEDLWLHAKDVSGSHVLLKYQAGKNFPKDVIQRAAELAAYYSKRKNESLCPVSVTQKKYVRKRKGDPAGLVVVEREEVVMVGPLG